MRDEFSDHLPHGTRLEPSSAAARPGEVRNVLSPKTLEEYADSIESDDGSGERAAIGRLGSVLVVEADPDQQYRLARDLTRAGARVVGTSSGEGALSLVREWAVDMVLVSDDLPGMDGYELCRRIINERPEQRIIMMAEDGESAGGHSLADAARAVGAEDCLMKPVDLPALGLRLTLDH